MEYVDLQVKNEKIIVIDDTVDIKVIRDSNGYIIRILENYAYPINVEFTDNIEEFEV